jgi:hypothetical protein
MKLLQIKFELKFIKKVIEPNSNRTDKKNLIEWTEFELKMNWTPNELWIIIVFGTPRTNAIYWVVYIWQSLFIPLEPKFILIPGEMLVRIKGYSKCTWPLSCTIIFMLKSVHLVNRISHFLNYIGTIIICIIFKSVL